MHLISLLNEKSIVIPLKGNTKEKVIEELLLALKREYRDLPIEQMKESVLQVEKEQSTLLGNGVFFPHVRTDEFSDMVIACGISSDGIEMEAVDKEPIRFVFLIICPFDKNTIMIQARAALLKLWLKYREQILMAKKPQDFMRIVEGSDIRLRREITAGDMMRAEIAKIYLDTTLEEIVGLMFSKAVGTLPVIDSEGHLEGVVSTGSIIRLALPEYVDRMPTLSFLRTAEPFANILSRRKEITAKELMTKDFARVGSDTSIMEVLFIMARDKAQYVYVVDEGKLMGLISQRELITKILTE